MSDLIDRQAAIDAVESAKTAQTPDGEIYVAKINAEMNIQILPSAQPRPKGQWLPDNRNYYEERFVCSVCKRIYEVDTCMGEPTWDFCPGCGAGMREEEQDE